MKHFTRGGQWLDDDAPSECSLLVRYQTQDQDPLFLPELPKDPHPTNRESGDHSAVGHCQEAVTVEESCPEGIIAVHLGLYLHIFHREAPKPAKKTGSGN